MKNTLSKVLLLFITVLTLSLSLGVSSFAAFTRVFERCVTVNDVTEIKTSPYDEGDTNAVLNKGDSLIRVARDFQVTDGVSWDRVLLNSGRTGYVRTDYISVSESAEKLELKKDSVKAGVNETIDIKPYIKGYTKEIRFFSSNQAVLSVTKDGKATCLKKGSAFIGIYTESKTAVFNIEVLSEPTAVTLNEKYTEIKKTDTFDLNSYCVGGYSLRRQFGISDESIATVNSSGVVTPKKNGTVTVCVRTYNGKKAYCKIKICDHPVKVAIVNENNTVQKGSDNHRVNIRLTNGSYVKKVYYSVSNKKIATVDENGYVTGKRTGKTVLTVKTDSGVYSSVTLYVTDDSLFLNRNATQVSLDYKNVTKIKYGYSYHGRNLEAFIITNADSGTYKKTLFMDFAIHGFEDEYFRDGQVLVKEGNALVEYFAKHSDLLGDYRLVIVPCANPDGTHAGRNNLRASKTAFGRCTANHVDMNRDFGAFRAKETVALKNIIVKSKPTVYLNFHGWYNEAIGSKDLCKLIKNKLGLKEVDNHYGASSGYAIGWVHYNLGIPVALVEYPSSSEVYTDKDIKMILAITKTY